MIRFFVRLFNKLPGPWRSALKYRIQPFVLKVSSIKNLGKDLRVTVYTIIEPDGLKVGYIGHGEFLPYLKSFIFCKKGIVELAHRIFLGNLNREFISLSKEYDLIISNLHQFYLKKYFSNLFIRIPNFVRLMLDLPDNHAELGQKIKTKESRKDMNKVKRNGFASKITNDQQVFKFFYEEFHRLFITSRHGDYAYILPYETLVSMVEEGELLMVKQGAQYVSGVLCRRLGDKYETICSGVY